jgi:hypothetical protein
MKTKLTLMALFVPALFHISCSLLTEPGNGIQSPTLIPMAIGNFWIYIDSATGASGNTIRVTGVENKDGYTWWQLDNKSWAASALGNNFGVRNDTIFSKEQGKPPSSWIITKVFIKPVDSSVVYMSAIGGDVIISITATHYKSQITVPAGTFNEYFTYVYNPGYMKDSVIIVPHIGIVARIYQSTGGIVGPAVLLKSYLKSYKILN